MDPGLAPADRVFRYGARGIGLVVLAITLAIGGFLGYQGVPTLHRYGLSFFTESRWLPNRDIIGLASVLLGTFEVALIALVIGIPLAFLTALYISEYAPAQLRSLFVGVIDLMAAIPAIIYGLWALFVLEPHAIDVARWLNQNLGWIPIFRSNTDADAANWARSSFSSSAFIAGIAVSMMVIPLACSVMRSVFAETPDAEREAAISLGATRFGVIRLVVLPFGRRGIIGATMLAFGRALGETIAVLLIISPAFEINFHVLSVGTMTVSALIADQFGEASKSQLSALLAAGFVLFLITLVVNTIAAVLVNRSRSGAATEI
ncbi:MAG: phosphate transporter permease [Ilumatobacteraceae bacterium]|nr:phosphate transporter permease [Ilumatobacteraceae bacterium]